MPYIEQSEPDPGCLFCRIASDPDSDVSNHVVHRGPGCLVMLNLYPYNSGHLMVAPFQHTGRFEQVLPENGAEMFNVAQLCTHVLTEAMKPDGFNMGINQGEVAGAGIRDHIHLHVVPRWNGDTNFMPVLADAKVMPELITATAAKLRPLFARESGE